MDLLQPLAISASSTFTGLLVVGAALHFGPDTASLDQLLEPFQGPFDVLPGAKPHSQALILSTTVFVESLPLKGRPPNDNGRSLSELV